MSRLVIAVLVAVALAGVLRLYADSIEAVLP